MQLCVIFLKSSDWWRCFSFYHVYIFYVAHWPSRGWKTASDINKPGKWGINDCSQEPHRDRTMVPGSCELSTVSMERNQTLCRASVRKLSQRLRVKIPKDNCGELVYQFYVNSVTFHYCRLYTKTCSLRLWSSRVNARLLWTERD